jgi:DNA-binding SARP family transcriptional activator
MTRQALFMVTAAVAIAVYLGLAIYVVTRNPRRSISWVFGAFCLTVASFYFNSLFLFPESTPPSPVTSFPLRLKWATSSFSPVFYLHLTSFYFPTVGLWRRARFWALLLAYLSGAVLAWAALFTDLLVAAPLFRSSPYIIGAIPGPLMYVFLGLFGLEVTGGIAGLVAGCRATHSPSLRRQILYLLVPSALAFLSGVANWIIVLTLITDQIPYELGNSLLILAAFFFAGAVLRYGAFAGHPIAWRDLFYGVLAAAAGLAALYLALALDQQVMTHTPFPYPLITGLMAIVIAVSFPATSRWAMLWLDRTFFRSEGQRQAMTRHLVRALAEASCPNGSQAEVLGAFCAALTARGGYIALSEPDAPPETLVVCAIQGNLAVRLGEQVRRPSVSGPGPQLTASLLFQEPTESGWRDIALLCPIAAGGARAGLLALGEKRDRGSFTAQDLAFCAELARGLDTIRQMAHLRERRNGSLKAAHLHDQTLRQLGSAMVGLMRQNLTAREQRAAPPPNAPLEIRLLGSLRVICHGQPVPEAAWGTEKAKAMLAYLLWKSPSGVTREELTTALWPDRTAQETADVFHVTLHRLRRVLEPELKRCRDSRYILYEGGRYRFEASAACWLDVTVFRALAGRNEPEALREAVALYRGSYLEDVDWALPPEAEWERRVMERLYVDALRRLAAQAEGGEVVFYLEKLLTVEPADEAAQRALVIGYLASGRRDLARRQVVHWRAALAELDIDPPSEIKLMWQRIESGALAE